MPDIITCGELLIDFVPTESGVPLVEAPTFKKALGGAPANVAVGVSRLGASAGFIGKVGDDPFGHFLRNTLHSNDVDISSLKLDPQAPTMLAFVSLRADGERDFMFYGNPGTNMRFSTAEIDQRYIEQAKLFHFCSISLISEPFRSATLEAVRIARRAGAVVSYDPNWRPPLWPGDEEARREIMRAWPLADVIKVSEEEVAFLKPTDDLSDLESQVRSLWHDDLKLLIVTRASKGCVFFTTGFSGQVDGFAVDSVDTTGAGDAFVAALLSRLLNHPEAVSDKAALTEICRFANATGALTTTGRGAIASLPDKEQVTRFLNR